MDAFDLGKEFENYKSILDAKRNYETASKSILSKSSSKFIIADGELKTKFVYQSIKYQCKAGPERPSSSKGLRASSTYKKNCPVFVS